jgi:predicted MFS family arabinose efflux permease
MWIGKRTSRSRFSLSSKLSVGWLTLFVVGSDLFVISPLLPFIAVDYKITPAAAGLSVTVFAVTYMLSAPLLGHLADRVGRKSVLTCALFAFAAGNLSTAIAPNFTWLLAARSLSGAAAAGVSPSVYALITGSAPPDRRGTWLAIAVSGLMVSLSLGAPLGLLAATAFGWRAVFAVLGILSLVLILANHRVWGEVHPVRDWLMTINRSTAITAVPPLLLTMVWSTAVYAMYTYLGEALTALGYSAAEIAEVIMLYGAGAIGGALVGGRMADHYGARLTIAIALATLSFGFLLLLLAIDAEISTGYLLGILSFVAQLFFPAQQLTLASKFPAHRAALLAWNNSALFLGISLGSSVGGAAISLDGFRANLMISAAIALAGWVIHQIGAWHGAYASVTQLRRRPGTQGAR